MMSKVDKHQGLIRSANGRLRRDGYRITIVQRNRLLSLRAIFPPILAKGETKSKQRRLPLGIPTSTFGITEAEKIAREVGRQLISRKFKWSEWGQGAIAQTSIGNWVNQYEKYYWQRREKSPSSWSTWRCDYDRPFSQLPQHKHLTTDLLIQTMVQRSKPDTRTRTRKRFYSAYVRLAKFAKLDLEPFEGLRGSYGPASVKEIYIPTPDEIFDWFYRISDPRWRNVYAAIAGCGARRHEGLLCEYRDPALRRIHILDGKTGPRVTYPYPINWLQLWRVGEEGFPNCQAPNFSELGSRVTVNWRRTGIPFTPLGARHACAIRLMGKVSVVAAAKSLGHSPAVHLATYQR